MSSRELPGKSTKDRPLDAAATPIAPTDNRPLPSRFEPIVEDDDGASETPSTGSHHARRRTDTPASYGTMTPSTSRETSVLRPAESSQTGERAATGSARSPMIGPERRSRSKKPSLGRRASSNIVAPHRGQEFSVDDDVGEVQEDALASRQPPLPSFPGTLRHQPSTLRRRSGAPNTPLSRVASKEAETVPGRDEEVTPDEEEEPPMDEEDITAPEEESMGDEDHDGDVSDAESFTLKDRQQAINQTHPFGIRIWKPALYKKNRSVQQTAEGDIHSAPGGRVNRWLVFFNLVWTLLFGWWLALVACVGAIVCFIFAISPSAVEYGRVLWGLSGYLFYPFGKFVRLAHDEAYLHEDEGEGRPITEYEQWQSGDIEDGHLFFSADHMSRSIVGHSRRSIDSSMSETDSLLGHSRGMHHRPASVRMKRRLFGRGQWNLGRVIFFAFFYGLITPLLYIVSGICWFMVFWIPMGKVTMLLLSHLRRHPLALSFHRDTAYSRNANMPNSSILLCTYRAVGLTYWKYTVDGTNIFLINLMGVVLFVIFDSFVLTDALGLDLFITQPLFLFVMSLFSVIPLAYFIGQAVASISAQSSMGVGAAINAFFSTIVEVFLYCVALKEGKGRLVEGSIVGSVFAGILFLPGISMCFGAIKRKTQRFNAKSAGVTSTMLLFAVLAAFGPTLFYQIYGTHELNCLSCIDGGDASSSRDCRRCYFSQSPTLDDRFYIEAVRPFCWIAAILLFLSYIIGLWFTLRTHAAVIWNSEVDEKKSNPQEALAAQWHAQATRPRASQQAADGRSNEIRDSQLYKRILGQSLKQVGLNMRDDGAAGPSGSQIPHLVPPKSSGDDASAGRLSTLSEADNAHLVREVAEIAATVATVAARDASQHSRTVRKQSVTKEPRKSVAVLPDDDLGAIAAVEAQGHEGGGHDAPNWSRMKSSVILMGATVLYAVIAEILVEKVDVVLQNVAIEEKFLGITLFALVPNTTEFLNAISFAMNGNIALSMEIGSAYALQVCMLQIPALILFSAVSTPWLDPSEVLNHTFSLIFPQWDMVTVIICVFLLSYMYGEGKSNYFKGSILLLSYFVVVVGFWFAGKTTIQDMGVSRFDVLEAGGSFRTIGRRASGMAVEL